MISRIYLALLLARVELGLRWNLAIGHWLDVFR